MATTSRQDIERFTLTFERLAEKLEAIRSGRGSRCGFCAVVFPTDAYPAEIPWPRPYDTDKFSEARSQLLREEWLAGYPIREYMLTETSESIDRFLNWADAAGDITRQLPSSILDDIHEPPAIEGRYVWLDVILDLALAALPGSALRVADPEAGGRWQLPRSRQAVPAGDQYRELVWFTEIKDVFESSVLVIEEILLRLRQRVAVADVGDRLADAAVQEKSLVEVMDPAERSAAQAAWLAYTASVKRATYADFDRRQGWPEGTIKQVVNASRSAENRARNKKNAAKKRR